VTSSPPPLTRRNAIIVRTSCNIERLLDAVASDRRDDAKLGKMRANGIDDRVLLALEEMARTMEHEAALLFCRLGVDKPHVWPSNRFADCLGIGGIHSFSL
jgi:hypothetical protein